MYKLIYRTTEDDRWPVRNDVVTRIWYVAKRRGLTMPYPVVRQINYDADGPFVPPVVPPVEQLRHLSKVSTLSGDEGEVRALTFGRDEVIFSEGSELSGVYLLISGAVSLEVGADGAYRPIGAVAAGEYFGEAGMYGVQPAEMRAVASLDCAVLWMSPETVRTLFEASPAWHARRDRSRGTSPGHAGGSPADASWLTPRPWAVPFSVQRSAVSRVAPTFRSTVISSRLASGLLANGPSVRVATGNP